jgi:hypothetical protein
MLLLLAIVSSSPPPPVRAFATANVRIERPVTASETDWGQLPEAQRREIIIRDERGRPILLRLIENQ